MAQIVKKPSKMYMCVSTQVHWSKGVMRCLWKQEKCCKTKPKTGQLSSSGVSKIW